MTISVTRSQSSLKEPVKVAAYLLGGYPESSTEFAEARFFFFEYSHYVDSFFVARLKHYIVKVLAHQDQISDSLGPEKTIPYGR
jgi:hypothetical protein